MKQNLSLVHRVAGWRIQKCQFEMIYITKSLQNGLSLLQLLNHNEEGAEKGVLKKNSPTAFYFYFPSEVSVISLLDTICVSYSTHRKAEKHARKGEIFSVSFFLWTLGMSSSVFSPFNERYAHPSAPIFFSFSIDDVKQALQYLFCDLIKSMTTKNVSLMAMTSSEGYTWMGLICIGKQSSPPAWNNLPGNCCFPSKCCLHHSDLAVFWAMLAECRISLSQDGSPISVLHLCTHQRFSFTYGYKCTQSTVLQHLGMWHFGDILKLLPSRCYPPIYLLSSETSSEASSWVEFRAERSFVPQGLHGCEFLEPGR